MADLKEKSNSTDEELKKSIDAMSTDVSGIKDAMGRMIVNIVPDGSGGLTIHHYDGTIDTNTVVEEMSSDDVGTIIGNYESSGSTE